MNIELLQKVKAHILEEPRRFNLGYWGGIVDPKFYNELLAEEDEGGDEELESVLAKQRPPCGAVGCIAGNVCILAGLIKPTEHFDGGSVYEMLDNTQDIAADALGLDVYQAARLFFLPRWGRLAGWPSAFADRLNEAKPGSVEYAQITAERIDHFIATNGAE